MIFAYYRIMQALKPGGLVRKPRVCITCWTCHNLQYNSTWCNVLGLLQAHNQNTEWVQPFRVSKPKHVSLLTILTHIVFFKIRQIYGIIDLVISLFLDWVMSPVSMFIQVAWILLFVLLVLWQSIHTCHFHWMKRVVTFLLVWFIWIFGDLIEFAHKTNVDTFLLL